ncbi:PD-(D/E)XK nuclease family protein [Verminephrobacter eiseniae]|uniref:PD-(D/E)XK nuclease family protein n=1 Tax=Verminephrobacter eiseniae TaxID=364317 RepID=UPI0022370396|nr:PD-(D/E)XK nuclease family protein [Verminephrobacter eiseniae]MCW5261642.1 PD-(D/E)XK nuclease family protein [Verminephrobacter eiseniae]
MRQQGAHPARTVVLLPYAQLMPWAQQYWERYQADGFAPRFETTRSWARRLCVFEPQGDELAGDVARDTLTARALLDRAGLAAQRDMLAAPLQEAASALAAVVAAMAPAQRAAWGEQARSALAPVDEGSALRFEAVVARIALEWVLASRHATDVLFESGLRQSVDALVLLQGFQVEPLAQALQADWGAAALTLAWPDAPAPAGSMAGQMPGHIALHPTRDAEDEAQRAAACVLRHLAAGRAPVALAANDRALTRRIAAHLSSSAVAVRDENGWTLSTTRAAAQLMAALEACAWNASADAVLDWLKQAPAIDPAVLDALERALRKAGVAHWPDAVARNWSASPAGPALTAGVALVQGWRAGLHAPRPLAQWLQALRALLLAAGQWPRLEQDSAGSAVLAALRLQTDRQAELDGWHGAGRRMALAEFSRWASEVLEAARYKPPGMDAAPVVVLPLPQLLARPFAALVLPGCDEKRLPPAPDPAGQWTPAQRQAWGLPSRQTLESAQRAAWHNALQTPAVDLLWRTGDEGGEPLLASALVLALQLDGLAHQGADPRCQRRVAAAPTARPSPQGQALPLQRLSATAYADLRHCPYRFFALRQLGLQEADELAADIDKRDFGNWLHAVLQHFHEALRDDPAPDDATRSARMDSAAQAVTRQQGRDEGDFLPFTAGWPPLRDGYLRWLAQHEQAGARFRQAEWHTSQPLDSFDPSGTLDMVQLVGTIDRIDTLSSTDGPGTLVSRHGSDVVGCTQPSERSAQPIPSVLTSDATPRCAPMASADRQMTGGATLVIDYKTENDSVTRQRISAGTEDTQLAFYAALLGQDSVRAAYVNVGERGQTQLHEPQALLPLRDRLLAGIRHDLGRIAAGAALPALGEGQVCEYCAARGLCRKDFWP